VKQTHARFKTPPLKPNIKQLKDSVPSGASGQILMQLAGTLSKDAAAEMKAAIEEGCEQVDPHGW